MKESVTFLQAIYQKIAEFLVAYSFDVLGALLILFVGFKVSQWVARGWMRFADRKHFDQTLSHFIAGAIRLSILGFAILVSLGKFGITITPLVAALSALAFGSSFAIQGPLSNYGAGLSLLLTRPFVVGDTVTVIGVNGVVEDVKLACTVLSTEDGEKITIPNKHIVGEVLKNSKAYRITETHVGISYADDPQRAIDVINTVLSRMPAVASTPAPAVGIHEFGDSSVIIGLRYWADPKQHSKILYAVNLAIYQALKDAQITIPFPQRDVRLISGSIAPS